MSQKIDCGHQAATSGNRRPKKGCRCKRCEELRADRRAERKVENMTEEQREKKNAAQRIEGISEKRRERRNATQRVENMTPAQLKRHRAAGAARSRLHRQRQHQQESNQ